MVFLNFFKPGHFFPLPEISRGICGPKVRRSLPDHIVAVIQDQAVEAKHLQNSTTSGAVPLTSPISRPHAEPPKGQSKNDMFKPTDTCLKNRLPPNFHSQFLMFPMKMTTKLGGIRYTIHIQTPCICSAAPLGCELLAKSIALPPEVSVAALGRC